MTNRNDFDQGWYWTPEWQTMEAEADKELVRGNYKVFDDMDEFLADLDNEGD